MNKKLSRQEYWSGLPCPPPGDLPDPGIEPGSPVLQADSLMSESPRKPRCRIDKHLTLHQPVLGCWLPREEPGTGRRQFPLAECHMDKGRCSCSRVRVPAGERVEERGENSHIGLLIGVHCLRSLQSLGTFFPPEEVSFCVDTCGRGGRFVDPKH